MPSKSRPLTKAQLAASEARRDLAGELLESIRQMRAGQTHVVTSPVAEARRQTGLSQSQFAILVWSSLTQTRTRDGRFDLFGPGCTRFCHS